MQEIKLQIFFVGKNYLVIAKDPNTIIETACALKMVDTFSQWLFFVSDKKTVESNISAISTKITEGSNIALALNMTGTQGCTVTIL